MCANQSNPSRARGSNGGSQRGREAVENLISLCEDIRRVASFASLFRDNRDLIDAIENNEIVKEGLNREKYIQELREQLNGMEYLKNIEIKRKDREIEELKKQVKSLTNDKTSLEDEKKKIEEDKAKASRKWTEDRLTSIADRKKEKEQHKEELKDQKKKLEEKAKKELAAKEEEFKKKENELKEEKAAIITKNEQLQKELDNAREEVKKEVTFRELLLKDYTRLDSELGVVQSRCPIQSEDPGVFKEELDQLSQKIKMVTADYFTHLPAGDMAKYHRISQKLARLHKIFSPDLVSNLPTPASTFLRIRIAQYFIMENLKREVWRPFRSSALEKQNKDSSLVLQTLSTNFRDLNQEEEIPWRVWTYKALDAVTAASPDAGDTVVQTSVDSIITILAPIIRENMKSKFKEDLTEIFEAAASLWTRIRADNSRISIDFTPPSQKSGQTCDSWEADSYDSIDLPGEAAASSSKDVVSETWEPWCLFPRIESRSINDELHILHRGSALFPDCSAFVKGRLEQDEMLRNVSVSAVPLSPISMASNP